MKHLRKLNARIASLLQWVCGALCLTITALMFVQVLIRYLGEQPLNWSEEAIRYLFVWAAFLGAALAQRFSAHVVLDLFPVIGGRRIRALRTLVTAVFGAFLMVVLVSGGRFAQSGFGVRSVSLDMPVGYVYSVVPLSAAIMLMFLFEQWRSTPDD